MQDCFVNCVINEKLKYLKQYLSIIGD